ncbi:hypothetical protein [Paenibacillus sp. FSL L8-0709]|uniref:hypothetical protein n=1 Tax=Paenibacillus sp. FSL L8-0709 TaxID=2975312 RepID=UPI0030F8515F
MTFSGDNILKVFIIISIALIGFGMISGTKKPKNNQSQKVRSDGFKLTSDTAKPHPINNKQLIGPVDQKVISSIQKINDFGRQGFTIALEATLLLDNPQLLQQIHSNVQVILAKSEISCLKKYSLDSKKGFFAKMALKSIDVSLSDQKNVRLIDADDSYIKRKQLNPVDHTDRSVATYLKEEERNLLQLLVVGYKSSLLEKCRERGLRIEIQEL